MKGYWNMVRASIYKYRHSKLAAVHILVPFLAIAAFGGYYSYSPWSLDEKISVYLQAVAMVFPFLISAVIAIVYENEKSAGGFQMMLSNPYKRAVSHLAGLTVLMAMGLFSCLFAILGLGAILSVVNGASFFFAFYMKASIWLFLSNISVYILLYILCFSLGHGVCLAGGIVGTLLSPLLLMGIGDTLWYYIPFSYGGRISMYHFYQAFQKISNPLMKADLQKGTLIGTIVTALFIVFFFCWSTNWQGAGKRENAE
ncbi:MAG: lantibiotic immunity ABC transporter MutG family permease subunit [Lachnospiraceae bacterium]|nr:lantibiotic immunity ABC transporter MutG family permease subunit [Lachnospiraceae bacterium]